MSTEMPQYPACKEFPHLEVISILGEVFDRGEVLKASSVEDWSLEDICYCKSSSQRAAEALARRTQRECWVVDRKNGNRVTFRFTPANGLTLPD